MRHCHINDGEKRGRDQQANGVGGCPPKVKAAQEAGPTVARTMVGKKLCLKAQPEFRDLKTREE